MKERTYIAIDLKSFYASVECEERGLDPLTTNLVVADASRTEKTICLAVSPSLKSFGISGRARLFEVVERVKQVNAERLTRAPGRKFTKESCNITEIRKDPAVRVDYLVAKPRMARYMEVSTQIYDIYLKYIAPEDIHVYSIDEVFIDVTNYLKLYGLSPRELCMKLIREVLSSTGITATAGIGTNMYLCKIAMDIVAKHIPADENGVRIAELDERTYREQLWDHKPLTDFWRVGAGITKRLQEVGITTMGEVARCSIGKPTDFYNEDLLYKIFGVNAELLIDHAWGYEPTTIADIKAYKPEANSMSSGQVLQRPYTVKEGEIVVREMTENLVLELVEKGLLTDQIVLSVGYDIDNMKDPAVLAKYKGEIKADRYGRELPKMAHGSANIGEHSSSGSKITKITLELYHRIMDPDLLIRRIYVVANHILPESEAEKTRKQYEQFDLFTDYDEVEKAREKEEQEKESEKRRQRAVLEIRKKFGKNAIFRGTDLQKGATQLDRNGQIGGHKA